MKLFLILHAITLIGLSVVQCDSSMIQRFKGFDGKILNTFTYEIKNNSCKRNYCYQRRAYCTNHSCCECGCSKKDFLISISEGCFTHRTWNDAGARLDGKIVPLITLTADLENLTITVPKFELNHGCSIGSIHYYDSITGEKRLLVKNPPDTAVVFKTKNGYGHILVNLYCLSYNFIWMSLILILF